MKRHVLSTGSYYTVSGPRKEVSVNEQSGTLEYTGVMLEARVRFESLELRDAENFASDVYRRENIVLEIHQVDR
jgi:hypothetical protein